MQLLSSLFKKPCVQYWYHGQNSDQVYSLLCPHTIFDHLRFRRKTMFWSSKTRIWEKHLRRLKKRRERPLKNFYTLLTQSTLNRESHGCHWPRFLMYFVCLEVTNWLDDNDGVCLFECISFWNLEMRRPSSLICGCDTIFFHIVCLMIVSWIVFRFSPFFWDLRLSKFIQMICGYIIIPFLLMLSVP